MYESIFFYYIIFLFRKCVNITLDSCAKVCYDVQGGRVPKKVDTIIMGLITPNLNKGNGRFNQFSKITSCSICNELKLCRKYKNELVCEECSAKLSQLCSSRKINGVEALEELRRELGLIP